MKNIKLKATLFLKVLASTFLITSCSKSDSPSETQIIEIPTTAPGTTIVFSGGNSSAITVGGADGPINAATFNNPTGICADISGNLYITERLGNKIRKISSSGVVSTLVPENVIINPTGICVDGQGNLYVSEIDTHTIKKVSPSGTVTNFAGIASSGDFLDGAANVAKFNFPRGISIDNTGNLYVADTNNHRIRKITQNGTVTTLAGSSPRGFADGNSLTAKFSYPIAICIDSSNNIYVTDATNVAIRKITLGGDVTTLAGGIDQGDADGIGGAAKFYDPIGLTVDGQGNIYLVDSRNKKIKKITSTGAVTTILQSANYVNISGIVFSNNKLFITEPNVCKIHLFQL